MSARPFAVACVCLLLADWADAAPYASHGYPWEHNDLGITSQVPAPWTALVYDGDRVRLWGREYDFDGSVLPRQITSQGVALFGGTPELRMQVDGETISMEPGGWDASHNRADHRAETVLQRSTASGTVTATTSLEYDGLYLVTVTFAPDTPTTLSDVQLTLPMRRDVARMYSRYIDYDFDAQALDRRDFLRSFGTTQDPVRTPFVPTFWLGNHDVGLEWSCETNAGWSLADPGDALALVPRGDTVDLVVRMVTAPVVVHDSWSIQFGLYPTPVKPLRDDWRKVAFGNARALGPVVRAQTHELYGVGWHTQLPLAHVGLPILKPETPAAQQEMEESLRDLREQGIHLVPYGALYVMPAKLPQGEWRDYAGLWRTRHPRGSHRNPTWAARMNIPVGEPSMHYICLQPRSLRDFLVWTYVQALEQHDIDGVYFDLGAPNRPCRNPEHDHPAAGVDGVEFYPLYAHRRLLQRLWVATKARNPDYLIAMHHAKVPVTVSGFTDIVLSGEALNLQFKKPHWTRETANTDPTTYVPDYAQLPDVMYEAQYSQNKGFMNVLLPQITKWNDDLMAQQPDLLSQYTRSLLARVVAYGIPVWRSRMDYEMYDGVIAAYGRFGGLANTTFLGPWESGPLLLESAEPLKVSLYLRPGDSRQVLVCVANFGPQAVRRTLHLDEEALRQRGLDLPEAQAVTNLLARRPVVTMDGGWPVELASQGYALYMVDAFDR